MTKQNFLHYYNNLSGADRTLVVFILDRKVYLYECNHIVPHWIPDKPEYESAKNGGHQKFRMRLTIEEKRRLTKKSIKVMTIEEFYALPFKNKGHKCEYFLHQYFNLEGVYQPDRIRFDKDGDIAVNGVKYQIKFQNATLTNVNVLHKAQKDVK